MSEIAGKEGYWNRQSRKLEGNKAKRREGRLYIHEKEIDSKHLVNRRELEIEIFKGGKVLVRRRLEWNLSTICQEPNG